MVFSYKSLDLTKLKGVNPEGSYYESLEKKIMDIKNGKQPHIESKFTRIIVYPKSVVYDLSKISVVVREFIVEDGHKHFSPTMMINLSKVPDKQEWWIDDKYSYRGYVERYYTSDLTKKVP